MNVIRFQHVARSANHSRPWLLALLLLAAVGCSSQARLQVEGATPYVRCLAGAPPSERSVRTGKLTLTLKDRTLTIAGGSEPVPIGVFSGPGMGGPLSAAATQSLATSGAQLLVMLGGLGPKPSATLRALSAVPQPLIFVAGGRDTWPQLEEAFSQLPSGSRIINATGMDQICIGDSTLIPIAGAESGRYAVDSAACGFGEQDLSALAERLGPSDATHPRWLLSWHAPAAGSTRGVTRTTAGVDTGSFVLARFMRRAGVRGGLAAWPAVQALRAELSEQGTLSRLVVPRFWGPRLERADGSRPSLGFALVTLDRSGFRLR